MPSILDLVHESSADLKDRARQTDGVNVSLSKNEHLKALSDEDIGEKARVILSANRPQLVSAANEVGLDHKDVSVPRLKELLLESVCGFSQGGDEVPYPTGDHEEKIPGEMTSHFETPQMRQDAIEAATVKAAEKAVRKHVTYHVIESFRPKDHNDPLRVARAYPDHSEEEIIVATVTVPAVHWPVQTTSTSRGNGRLTSKAST
jgi:hypothetical protein